MVTIKSCIAETATNYPVFTDIEQVLDTKKTLHVRCCELSLLSVYNAEYACKLRPFGP